MNPCPRAVASETTVVIVNRSPRRKIMGQGTPRAAVAIQVQDAVEHRTHVHRALTTARQGRWYQGLNQPSLFIREVRWIRRPCHVL